MVRTPLEYLYKHLAKFAKALAALLVWLYSGTPVIVKVAIVAGAILGAGFLLIQKGSKIWNWIKEAYNKAI